MSSLGMKEQKKGKDWEQETADTSTVNDAITVDCGDNSPKLRYFQLFRYAKKWELACVVIGLLASAANGFLMPLSMVYFADIVDDLISPKPNILNSILPQTTTVFSADEETEEGWPVVLFLLHRKSHVEEYGISTVFECQQGVLRQDVEWHEKNVVGSVITRLNDSIDQIEEGIGANLTNFLRDMSQFLTGLIIAFTKGWKLTLVAVALMPIISLVFTALALSIRSFVGIEQKAYSRAYSVAAEVLSAVRTVLAFGGEAEATKRYGSELSTAQRAGVKRSMAVGASVGMISFSIFSVVAVLYYYGLVLITKEEYTPGKVVLVIMNIKEEASEDKNPEDASVEAELERLKGCFSIKRSGKTESNRKRKVKELPEEPMEPADDDSLDANRNKSSSITWRTLKLSKPYAHLLAVGYVMAVGSGILEPSFALVYAKTFDLYFEPVVFKRIPTRAKLLAGMMSLVGFLRFLTVFCQYTALGVSGERLTKHMRKELFGTMLKQEAGWFDRPENQSGNLTSRLATEVPCLRKVSGERGGVIVEGLVLVIVSLILAFYFSWQLALVNLAFIPPLALFGAMQAQDMVSSVGTNSAINIYPFYCSEKKKSRIIYSVVNAVAQGVQFFQSAAVYYVGAKLIDDGTLTSPALFRSVLVLTFGAQGLGRAVSFLPSLNDAVNGARKIFVTLDRRSRLPADKGEEPSVAVRGEVEFRDVHFRYPTRPGVEVLKGYDTSVGFRGSELSGGQKQRIAIARALLRKPAILLFDEATSALDRESGRVVQATLDKTMAAAERTCLMVAHRLTTVEKCHQIVVLQNGIKVESGSPEALMRAEGVYFALHNANAIINSKGPL
nr:unnamed protein product [Spirometra erinaceieuropaei]